jgi:hypothetical protein
MTKHKDSTLVVGGLGVAIAAISLQYGIKAYNEYQASKATEQPESENVSNATPGTETQQDGETKVNKKERTKSSASSEPSFFASFFATTFYDGGFEDKMSKREAALILGLRESASIDRIKDAHRKMLINNHPDKGGSPLIAAKINEAKDLLMKGKQQSQ